MPKSVESRWIVSQIGAREHYAVPRAFQNVNQLRLFYTDAWSRRSRTLLQRGPGRLRALAGRYHPELPPRKVVDFTIPTLWEQARRPPQDGSTEAVYTDLIYTGKAFAERVATHLQRQKLNAQHDYFFGFDTGCLETLEWLRERGVITVVDQIDPARVEENIVLQEDEKWHDWQTRPGRIPEAYYQRLAQEWQLADLVLVNSPWSKKALVEQGVEAQKIIVVPLAYEPKNQATHKSFSTPFTVLWLGNVILRKGIQYLIEAARLLRNSPVRFVVAGTLYINDEVVKNAPSNMTFLGNVPRTEVEKLFQESHIFVLPTLSDGFAITQLEAMSHGLPVIATPRCGEVVEDGCDGRIVPAANAGALAETIEWFLRHRDQLPTMSQCAIKKSRQFSLDNYARRVESAVAHYRIGSLTSQNS